jgi:hypothetical protein
VDQLLKSHLIAGIPDEVVEQAKAVIDGMEAYGIKETPERKDLAVRLLSDPQMKSVWRVLLKPHKKRHFMYPVRIGSLDPFASGNIAWLKRECELLGDLGDKDSLRQQSWLKEQIKLAELQSKTADAVIRRRSPMERQASACRAVYMAAFTAGAFGQTVMTSEDVSKGAEATQGVAMLLEGAADLASRTLGWPIDVDVPVRELKKMAALQMLRRGDQLLVERQSSNSFLRAIAIKLSNTMSDLFGTPHYGQIARISNVILKRRDITLSRVRDTLRS